MLSRPEPTFSLKTEPNVEARWLAKGAHEANVIQLSMLKWGWLACRGHGLALWRWRFERRDDGLQIHGVRAIFADPIEAGMKEGIHPDNYRTVIFKDLTADWRFLGKSCAESKDTEAWEDGTEYPVIKVEVSSASHPFYTGKNTLVDTAGRIDKFRTRYAKHKK